jgi:hypothetical protein
MTGERRLLRGSDLKDNLKIGTIQIPLHSFREITSNDYFNTSGTGSVGGLLTLDSTPALGRKDGATDKTARITWVAGNVDEIQAPPIAKPSDLDSSQAVTVHLYAALENASGAPTVDIQFWDGIGDTECGGATGAISGTSVEERSVTIAATNIAAAPGIWNMQLIPAAHASSALYVYGTWIEYTRKD